MVAFTKMTKIEQVNAARANAAEVRNIQRDLEEVNNKQQQRMKEQEIERRVNEKMKVIGREQVNKPT